MADSYILQMDSDTCSDCGTCDKFLAGFRANNKGKIHISLHNYQKEHVQEAIKCVIEGCPSNSISIRNG